ncbi:hypothetical protein O181_000584 [Austropuccinia psidii MF-1]|uniref:Uncharacterized protein n=1 Tax=Austropuccinia psidii MF-1 TaxID=1389203 RepID=A0A9Q3GB23_9BASI|nr:hypothetical protein [Austropuccinia psidii MF-1]
MHPTIAESDVAPDQSCQRLTKVPAMETMALPQCFSPDPEADRDPQQTLVGGAILSWKKIPFQPHLMLMKILSMILWGFLKISFPRMLKRSSSKLWLALKTK